MQKNLIVTLILVVIAVVFIGGGIFYMSKNKNSAGMLASVSGAISSQQAGDKAIDFINKNLLQEGVTASLKEIKEESGLFKAIIKINQKDGEQDANIYVSRDGKFLFVQPPIEMKEIEKKLTETPKTEKPDVKLFVMSFCPYGNQAEDLIKPVLNLLKDNIDVKLNYIVSKDSNGKYQSLHGDQELNQGVREICVAKYQKDKFWDFVYKINEKCTSQNADTCWEQQAKDLGIDTEKIKNCQQIEASTLLAEEEKLVQEFGVSGSPQLFINGVEFTGERTSEGYKSGICSGFTTSPQECQEALSTEATSATGGCATP
jgi:glutaredoxin